MFNSSEEVAYKDGRQLFYQPDTYNFFERVVLFLRNVFKYRRHSQFLEICATSKEIMSFHDNGFVVLRFACGFNNSSIRSSYRSIMVDWKPGCIP